MLELFWIDLNNREKTPRQTVLGSFILALMSLLPDLRKKYNANQAELLQVISHFTSLGHEARKFLLEARGLERLLNYFHWDSSPYQEEFIKDKLFPF